MISFLMRPVRLQVPLVCYHQQVSVRQASACMNQDGSAPDIAGTNQANPIATILSAAMMLRYSLNLDKEADAIEAAVKAVLKKGFRTVDIMSEGCTQLGCKEMGDAIAAEIQ